MKISVIIITKDRFRSLIRLCKSIIKQSILPSEIIIIDSSISNTNITKIENILKELFRIKIYFKKLSIPAAREMGLELAKNSIIHFIDDDCELDTEVYAGAVRHFSLNSHTAALVGSIKNGNKKSLISDIQQYLYDSWVVTFFSSKNKLHISQSPLFFDLENTFLNRKLIGNVHFDVDVPYGRCEDIIFGIELYKNNKNVFYSNKLLVYHYPLTSLPSLLKRTFQIGYSLHYISIKYLKANFSARHITIKNRKFVLLEYLKKYSYFEKCLFTIGLLLCGVSYKLGKISYSLRSG